MTPAKRAKALKGQLADSEQKVKSATHAAEKERIKTEVLEETGGAVRKKDTWEDLAEKVCKPNPPPSTMQPRPPKKARPAADEDDAPLLVQREKSASGRILKPSTRRRDLEVEK